MSKLKRKTGSPDEWKESKKLRKTTRFIEKIYYTKIIDILSLKECSILNTTKRAVNRYLKSTRNEIYTSI